MSDLCDLHLIITLLNTNLYIPSLIWSFWIIFRYDEYAVVKANRDSVFEVLEKTINEFSHWQKLHKVKQEFLQRSTHQPIISHKLEFFTPKMTFFKRKPTWLSLLCVVILRMTFILTACSGEYPGSPVPEDVCWRGHPPQSGNHQLRPSHWLLTGRRPESDCVSGILTYLHILT